MPREKSCLIDFELSVCNQSPPSSWPRSTCDRLFRTLCPARYTLTSLGQSWPRPRRPDMSCCPFNFLRLVHKLSSSLPSPSSPASAGCHSISKVDARCWELAPRDTGLLSPRLSVPLPLGVRREQSGASDDIRLFDTVAAVASAPCSMVAGVRLGARPDGCALSVSRPSHRNGAVLFY